MRLASLICALVLASTCAAQSPDWIDKVVVPAIETESPLPPPDTQPQNVEPPAPEPPAISADAIDLLSRVEQAASKSEDTARKLSNVFDSLVTKDEMDEAIKKALDERKIYTEQEIRVFAKEEAEKVFAKVKVQTQSGWVSEVTVPMTKQHVSGYSGTFDVPAGGRVIEVDGKPVVGVGVVTGTSQQAAVAGSYGLVTSPQNPRTVVIGQSSGRVMRPQSQGASCTTIYNPVTGRFQTVCPNR